MAIEYWELRQRQAGNIFGADIARVLRQQYGDVPLNLQKREGELNPLSTETQQLVECLRKGGYAVYETLGKTPGSLRREGMKYWYLNPGLEDRSSNPALLAFKADPGQFFLRGSQNLPFEQMLKLLEEEKARVAKAYPDTNLLVRVGHFSELIELALAHFKATKTRILGRSYGYNLTWTDTYESDEPGTLRAIAGAWNATFGFLGGFWGPGFVYPDLRLVPLVEIPRK